MPRRRPLRTRPLVLIPLLLVAGAVVNVAVAWVLVGAPDSWTPGGADSEYLVDYTDEKLVRVEELYHELEPRQIAQHQRTFEQARRDLRAPGDWPPLGLASIERGVGWTNRTGTYGERGERSLLYRTASGWPARSMEFSCVFHEVERVSHYAHSFAPPQFLIPTGEWFPQPRHRLPLMPIPAGFAINTLFYAVVVGAILALPLSFFPIRRRRRARRGRCPTCGYDRAGLTDPAAPCPECGAAARRAEGAGRSERSTP